MFAQGWCQQCVCCIDENREGRQALCTAVTALGRVALTCKCLYVDNVVDTVIVPICRETPAKQKVAEMIANERNNIAALMPSGQDPTGCYKGQLVHILFNDYSPAECLRFLDNEQAITNSWLLNNNAFSVGLSDCILPAEGTQAVQAVIQDKLAQAYQLLHKLMKVT